MKPRQVMRTVRYTNGWKRGTTGVDGSDVIIQREGQAIPATFVRPAGARGRLPCWIAIGGVSVKGRFHPQLVRFAEALASSGAAVLVPELPEWRRLSVCPRIILPTVRASVEYLNGRADVERRGYGVIGFSFGAVGAVLAASDEEVVDHIRGAVVFGGYCCLTRTVGCMLTGDHEWNDQRHRLQPDPYGRWVVASNYLTRVPGYEDAADVAEAVKRLATEASSKRVSAWEAYHDPMISALRLTISPARRRLFDLLATPTTDQRPRPPGVRGARQGPGRHLPYCRARAGSSGHPHPRPCANAGHPRSWGPAGSVYRGDANHGAAAREFTEGSDRDRHDESQQGPRAAQHRRTRSRGGAPFPSSPSAREHRLTGWSGRQPLRLPYRRRLGRADFSGASPSCAPPEASPFRPPERPRPPVRLLRRVGACWPFGASATGSAVAS